MNSFVSTLNLASLFKKDVKIAVFKKSLKYFQVYLASLHKWITSVELVLESVLSLGQEEVKSLVQDNITLTLTHHQHFNV